MNLADTGTGGAYQGKEGMLMKRSVSATTFKNWRRRWIAVSADRITWHYDQNARVRGELLLEGARLRGADQGDDHPGKWRLAVINGTRELVLEMENQPEHQEWVEAIENAPKFKQAIASSGEKTPPQRKTASRGCLG